MKTFEMPKVEIIALDVTDIITSSDEWSTPSDKVWG